MGGSVKDFKSGNAEIKHYLSVNLKMGTLCDFGGKTVPACRFCYKIVCPTYFFSN